MLIVLTPVLMPVVAQFGINPVHFGLVFIIGLQVGLITPPVGISMYIACALAKIGIEDFFKSVLPFYLAFIAVMILIILVPSVILFIPNLLMGVK